MHERIQTIMSWRAWIALTVLIFAVAGVAPDAHAQSNKKEEAQQLAQKGAKAFVKKDYAMAVTYFQRAASLDPNPVLLYNLSLAHSKLGNVSDAKDAAQRAIDMGKEQMPEDTWVKLHARLDAYDRALEARSIATSLAPDEPEVSDRDDGGTTDPDTTVRKDVDTKSPISALGWAGAATGVVGVGLLAGAGLVNADVRASIDSYDEARRAGEFDRARQLESDIESGQQLGQILLYSGAGLAAVGAGLFIVDVVNGSESESRAAVFGAPSPNGASVTFHLRF
jgi:tetratricopeptide (TPR) repeat protein